MQFVITLWHFKTAFYIGLSFSPVEDSTHSPPPNTSSYFLISENLSAYLSTVSFCETHSPSHDIILVSGIKSPQGKCKCLRPYTWLCLQCQKYLHLVTRLVVSIFVLLVINKVQILISMIVNLEWYLVHINFIICLFMYFFFIFFFLYFLCQPLWLLFHWWC